MPSYWIGQLELKTEGEGTMRIVRRAEDDDVEGHRTRFHLGQTDDVEGLGAWRQLEPEGDATIETGFRHNMNPVDEEQGLYLVEVDSDEDVTGQAFRHLAPEDDAEGQVRGRY